MVVCEVDDNNKLQLLWTSRDTSARPFVTPVSEWNPALDPIIQSQKMWGGARGVSRYINIGTRSWFVIIVSTAAFEQKQSAQVNPVIVLWGGIALSFVFSIFLLIQLRYRQLQSEQLLLEEHIETLSATMASVAEDMLILDDDNLIVYANSLFLQSTGYTTQYLYRKHILDIIPDLEECPMQNRFVVDIDNATPEYIHKISMRSESKKNLHQQQQQHHLLKAADSNKSEPQFDFPRFANQLLPQATESAT
jgi:PAS domain S-box-containing protein